MSVAFLCPGQGAQRPGFLHRLPRHAEVDRTLAEASRILGREALDWDTAQALHSTAAVQLSIVIAGVATARALRALDVEPRAVAGLSVGAFTAAVICGALDFADAMELVRLRGELMHAAYPRSYGMGVVTGLAERDVRQLVERASTAEAPVYLSGVNSPVQLVIAGAELGIERCFRLARESGAHSLARLAVSVPSHCPLLAEVSQALAARLATVPLASPAVPYVTNRSARATTDPAAVRDDLSFNLMYPVRWHDATSLLYERGTRLFVELPPGRVLTNLASAAFPQARALAVAESSVAQVALFARRQRGAQ